MRGRFGWGGGGGVSQWGGAVARPKKVVGWWGVGKGEDAHMNVVSGERLEFLRKNKVIWKELGGGGGGWRTTPPQKLGGGGGGRCMFVGGGGGENRGLSTVDTQRAWKGQGGCGWWGGWGWGGRGVPPPGGGVSTGEVGVGGGRRQAVL